MTKQNSKTANTIDTIRKIKKGVMWTILGFIVFHMIITIARFPNEGAEFAGGVILGGILFAAILCGLTWLLFAFITWVAKNNNKPDNK